MHKTGTYLVEYPGIFKGFKFISDPFTHGTIDVYPNNFSIILRPLSEITDEEAKEVSQIAFGVNAILTGKMVVSQIAKGVVVTDYNVKWPQAIKSDRLLHVFQYLFSKGFAMPYMGFSVEQLIKANVYKIETT